MPFKSEAQRRKMAQLVKEGKIPQSVFDEFADATGKKKLPERLNQKKPVVKQVKVIR